MSSRQSESSSTDTEIDIGEIKTFYDSVYHANARADNHGNDGHYRRLFRKLGIQKNSHVLDVACGTGGWLKVCSDNGTQVSGVDLSDNAIKVCKDVMPQGSFYAQPAETLPFEDNTFETVTCLGSLEHFVDPEKSLREMIRVAKSNATFVILVPNQDFLTRKLGLFGGTYQVDAKEVVRTLDEWHSLFSSAGLTVTERWKDLHVINRHWITSGRFYTWPFRLAQSLLLAVWPLRWQYQVYHRCLAQTQATTGSTSPDAN
jgi:ubiquinone/menaquinone biosynthesis C-methylase UbiE